MLAVDVVGPIAAVAADPPLIVLAPAAVASLDRIALAQTASAAPPRTARIVPRAVAASGLLNVLLEDARFLLAVVICVNRVKTLPRGTRQPRVRRQKDTACAQSTSKVPSPLSLAMRPG